MQYLTLVSIDKKSSNVTIRFVFEREPYKLFSMSLNNWVAEFGTLRRHSMPDFPSMAVLRLTLRLDLPSTTILPGQIKYETRLFVVYQRHFTNIQSLDQVSGHWNGYKTLAKRQNLVDSTIVLNIYNVWGCIFILSTFSFNSICKVQMLHYVML